MKTNAERLSPAEKEPHYALRFLVLSVICAAVFLASFLLGRYSVDPASLLRILCDQVTSFFGGLFRQDWSLTQTWSNQEETVILQIRLPRIAAAALVGAALSTAGAAYQGMFRNPMVSPDILGASSGAGFGAAMGILMYFGYFGISVCAFAFGLGAVLLAYLISKVSRLNTTLSMVLAGIMVSSLFSSCTSFVKLIADTEEVLPAITYWLMGSLASIKPRDVWFLLIPVLAGLIPLLLLRWKINILTVSEEEAASLGINTGRLRLVVIFCATLMTAGSVAVSGMIGWVGLVIPHFCRMIFGYDYKRLIPASAVFGAAFLMVVDNIARNVATSEIPLGILTSFIGAPVFVYLILTGGTNRGR